nr:MAG TPA: hypothetical protein [Caudoviricetes sp.]
MVLEVYDKASNKTVDVEKDSYFKDYGVVIGLDGHMMLTHYGDIVCRVDDRKYGVRVVSQGGESKR